MMRDLLPAAIQRHPQLDQWVRIEVDGTVVVSTGKVEIGQGLTTAIAMIAADELDVDVHAVRVATAQTGVTPDEGVTAGSLSIEDSGSAVRVASAAARTCMLERWARQASIPLASLSVDKGVVHSTRTNRTIDYATLQGGRRFNLAIERPPSVKAPQHYRVVGKPATRVDLRDKLVGRAVFVHDLRLPGMVHARVVRPPIPGAVVERADLDYLASMPEVRVFRDGNFLAVVSCDEAIAVRVGEELAARCQWRGEPLPDESSLRASLRDDVQSRWLVVDGVPKPFDGERIGDLERAHAPLAATYFRPYQMHGSLGPSAAAAQYTDGTLLIWTHSQGIESLRMCLADALPLEVDRIRITHCEGAGCYGHNGADDAAFDAALIAMKTDGAPVLLQWTRAQEHACEPYGPAMLVDMAASVDTSNCISEWRHTVTSYSHAGRPTTGKQGCGLLGAWSKDPPLERTSRTPGMSGHGGSHRNADPIYDLRGKQIVKQFAGAGPLRTSSLRSLGAFCNVFAIESFMDELAHHCAVDPFEFRLRHLRDARATQVLHRLRQVLPESDSRSMSGRGIALARYKNRQAYAAVAVDIDLSDAGAVVLRHVWIVADVGLAIDPDGVCNQLEGAFIQSASWTLKEAVRFSDTGITSVDWKSYPILRFDEIPQFTTVIIDSPDPMPLGVGEAATGPTPAAIANAVFDAVGVRLRDLPFTVERVREAVARD